MFIVIYHLEYHNGQFLFFQPDPIDGVSFKPIKKNIHQGVIKIVDDEISYDFQLNTTESVIVGRDREEILNRIQRGFENQYHLYGKLKREDVNAIVLLLVSSFS